MSKSFWLVTRELGQTPRGKIATSAVVSFEKPRGVSLVVATRLAQFDSLVDDLADYMSRERRVQVTRWPAQSS